MHKGSPQVGVIADTSFLRHIVAHAVQSQGYGIETNSSPDEIDYDLVRGESVAAWLVELDDQDKWTDVVDELLEQAQAPIFFGDGQAPEQTSIDYPRWQRKIFTKLTQIIGPPVIAEQQTEEIAQLQSSLDPSESEIEASTEVAEVVPIVTPISTAGKSVLPERILVLGASLGGPAAVKLFLDQLPAGLPIAFVLAQHIDAGFQEVLTQVLGRRNHFKVSIAQHQQYLKEGEVIIAPVEGEIQFSAGGQIIRTNNPWNGPYSPSIDQVMMNVCQVFGDRSGAIIFSGMGNDSAIAGPIMKQKGCMVWAQTADSCANSSQPDSIRDTGCVDFNGTPQALAFQLVERIRRERRQKDKCQNSDLN